MIKVAKVQVKGCFSCPHFRGEDRERAYCTILYAKITADILEHKKDFLDACPLLEAIIDQEGNIV